MTASLLVRALRIALPPLLLFVCAGLWLPHLPAGEPELLPDPGIVTPNIIEVEAVVENDAAMDDDADEGDEPADDTEEKSNDEKSDDEDPEADEDSKPDAAAKKNEAEKKESEKKAAEKKESPDSKDKQTKTDKQTDKKEPAKKEQNKPLKAKPDDKQPAGGAKPGAAPNANPNWLEQGLKNLFGPPRKNPPPVVEKPAAGTAEKSAKRHPADMRAPYDPKKVASLRDVSRQIQEGQWSEVFELLDKLARSPEDSMIRRDDRWVSIREEIQRLIGSAPPEKLEAYRMEYAGRAQQELSQAERLGNLSAYGAVVMRYLHTPAGQNALNQMGSLHLDRDEFGLAARCFARLWEIHAPLTREPAWRVKAAYALDEAGQKALSVEILGDLSADGSRPVDLGGVRRNVKAWLASAARVAAPWSEALQEWWMMFGNPSRTGVAQGGEPLLLPRWQQSTTESQPIRTQLDYIAEDLSDNGGNPLPALFPVMVNGKVVFRTLHGVQVLDATSGRPLWESEEAVPIELALASGTSGVQARAQARIRIRFAGRLANNVLQSQQFAGGSAEYHPLSNLIFRNSNFGNISSDGQRLFVLEDSTVLSPRQPGQMWGAWDNSQEQQAVANKLTAYDLATGRPVWEAGGETYGEAFDLPLAGHFFFGVPVADGGELFVIGEMSNEIRLYSLDPATGRPLWSQLLAYSESKIENDIGRRWWSAQVAIDNGVLVCPTTVGWLVGIDRATRSLLWGQRITPPTANRNDMNETNTMVQSAPLNGRWAAAPPVIAGDRLIYTPLETQTIYCLDLYTGKMLWQKPRGELMYLAGVFGDKVVVVGRKAVSALELKGGATSWTLPAPDPTGRGVAVGNTYYLPLSPGELWSIDINTGKLLGKSFLPENTGPLGNLAMYQGMLLSLNASGMTAFEQRESIQSEIVRRKEASPLDVWALLREAEILALSRSSKEALSVLRKIPDDKVPADLAGRVRQLKIDSLTAVLRANLTSNSADQEIDELSRLAVTPSETAQFQRLRAEQFAERGEFEKAFEAFVALAEEPSTGLVTLDETLSLAVRHDAWLAGRLRDLWQKVPEAVRTVLNQDLTARAQRTLEGTVESRRKFAALFAFHPASVAVQRRLADEQAAEGNLLGAEQILVRLTHATDRATAASALERLARLMIEFRLPADAAQFYGDLERRFADVPIAVDGAESPTTGAEFVRTLREGSKLPAAAELPAADWHDHELRMERIGANFNNGYSQELQVSGSRNSFFRGHRLQIEQQEQRFEVVDAGDDRIHWSLPLRSKAGSPEGMLVSGMVSGHHVSLLHRGVLHSLSPVDGRVLWTHTLESRLGIQNFYSGNNVNPVQPMQRFTARNQRLAAATMHAATGGTLCLSNLEYVCYQGRRSLMVLDTLTGEPRWRYDGVRQGTQVFGNEDVIYLRPTDGKSPLALRALDGKRLDVPRLSELLNEALLVCGKDLVLAGTQPAPAAEGAKPQAVVKLRLYDPVAQQDVWSLEFPAGCLYAPVHRDQLAVIEPATGQADWVDLQSGTRKSLGTVPATDLKITTELFAVGDYDNVYFVVNTARPPAFYSENLPFIRTNGLVFAFDQRAGGLRWKQKVNGQNMILERLDHSPVLLFAARKHDRQGKVHLNMLNIQAYDKFTGTKLIEEQSASQSGFRSLLINMASRYLELRSYNERLRLSVTDKTAAAKTVAAPTQ